MIEEIVSMAVPPPDASSTVIIGEDTLTLLPLLSNNRPTKVKSDTPLASCAAVVI